MKFVWHFSATGRKYNIAQFLNDMDYDEVRSRLTISCEFDDFIAIDEVSVFDDDFFKNDQEITGLVAKPFEFNSDELEELFEELVSEYQLEFSLKVDFLNC